MGRFVIKSNADSLTNWLAWPPGETPRWSKSINQARVFRSSEEAQYVIDSAAGMDDVEIKELR